MSTIGGPNIVRDRLVFGYDTGYGVADNITSTRHYVGKPTTNLTQGLTTAFSNWAGLNGTSTYYTTTDGNQGVKLITTSSGGVNWYNTPNMSGILSSTQYTISATVRYEDGDNPSVNLFYIRQYNNGSQITEGGHFSTGFEIDLGGGWKRVYRTFQTTSTTSSILLHGYEYGTNRTIFIQDIQFELGSVLSPYAGVNGYRTNTTSLIDLKKTTTIDVGNISFDSTAHPTFDGTDDYMTVTLSGINLDGSCTIEGVLKRITTPTDWRTFFNIKHNSANAPFFEFRSGGNSQHIYADYYNVTTEKSTTAGTLLTGEYGHAVSTYDGNGTMKMYLNGLLIGTTTGIPTFTIGDNPRLTVGRAYSNDRNTDISAPIVKIYDKVLTQDEITQNYNSYKNRFNI